ncbi:MAG: response regulator transcription factor [Gammaproteobacteria bacterium]|nr:response regulator transcription factor [Gammaproteobacteria bacterium]
MTVGEQWRVMIVDDYEAMRETIRQVLAADPRFAIVAEAASGEEAIQLTHQMPLDLVLLDMRLPGINGLIAAEAIKIAQPRTVILILSSDWSPAYERRARAIGVRARLAKQSLSLGKIYRALD